MFKQIINSILPLNTRSRAAAKKLFYGVKELPSRLFSPIQDDADSTLLISESAKKFEVLTRRLLKRYSPDPTEPWPDLFPELLEYYKKLRKGIAALHDDLTALVPQKEQKGEYAERSFPKAGSRKRLKILYITGMFPSIEHGGGLRLFDILSNLTVHHRVDLYSVFNEGLDRKSYDLIKNKFRHCCLTRKSLPDVEDIAAWLNKIGTHDVPYDVIQLEYPTTVHLVDHLRTYGKKIGFTFMESISKSSAISVKNGLSDRKRLGERLHQFIQNAKIEKYISERADFLIALTPEDGAFIHALAGAVPYIVPTCVSGHVFNGRNSKPSSIEYAAAFVGFFDHTPNLEAMAWYYRNIHHRVKEAVPRYRIVVIGRGNTEQLQKMTKGDPAVVYTGQVDDVSEYLVKAKICISPLISGAGIRGKINQYSILGKPSVSTTIGLCGTPYVDGKSVLRADAPDAFAQCMIRLLTDNGLYELISRECRDVVRQHFGWEAHIRNLEAVYAAEPDPRAERSPGMSGTGN